MVIQSVSFVVLTEMYDILLRFFSQMLSFHNFTRKWGRNTHEHKKVTSPWLPVPGISLSICSDPPWVGGRPNWFWQIDAHVKTRKDFRFRFRPGDRVYNMWKSHGPLLHPYIILAGHKWNEDQNSPPAGGNINILYTAGGHTLIFFNWPIRTRQELGVLPPGWWVIVEKSIRVPNTRGVLWNVLDIVF